MSKLPSFKDVYNLSIKKELQEKFAYKNVHAIPKIKKIVINMGVGKAASDSKVMNRAVEDLKSLSGQKPVVIKTKKSIAAFKIREGMPIGTKVTLRRDKMYDFLVRLVVVALPRTKEFNGFSVKNFDGRGNFNFGIVEQIVFPEIDYDKIDSIRGMNITIVTSALTDEEGRELLSRFSIPFYN